MPNRLGTTNLYGSARLGAQHPEALVYPRLPNQLPADLSAGSKRYELTNHLGNVLCTVSDLLTPVDTDNNNTTDHFAAIVHNQQAYYPFGMLMPGLQYTPPGERNTRYGFNGKENDDEVKGRGNSVDFGARIYDARLGRWMSVDPYFKDYLKFSTFNFTLNNPILYIDPDGNKVTIKDVASFKAMLSTLTEKDIKRIIVDRDGSISISGNERGSKNLENLRVLVNSKVNHVFITTDSYKSASGDVVKLPSATQGRTLFPVNEADEMDLDRTLSSPDENVYVIIKPTNEEGAAQVVAHEAFGHAVLGEGRRKGLPIMPTHKFGRKGEENEAFKKQGWGAVSEARKNWKENSGSKTWKREISKKIKEFNSKTRKS